jgi:hypothetical protein
MNTKQKIMGLAALPLAGLLVTGGVAMAQGAGAPAGTQVVQQAAVHKTGDPCLEHVVKAAAGQAAEPCPQHAVKAAQPACQQQARDRDRGCGTCRDDHPVQAAKTAASTVTQPRHDGSCDHYGDHGDR